MMVKLLTMLWRWRCVLCSLEWQELLTDQEQKSSLGWLMGLRLEVREVMVVGRWIHQLVMNS